MSLQQPFFPSEVLAEIFKFIGNLNFLFELMFVCKDWKNIFVNNDHGLCTYFYQSYFSWRNDPFITKTESVDYFNLLQKELKYWNSWKFKTYPKSTYLNDFETSVMIKNGQRLLQITRKLHGERKSNVTQSIYYNTGVYYFEIKSLKNCEEDSIKIGFIKNNYRNSLGFLGNNNESFGYSLSSGLIFGKTSTFIGMGDFYAEATPSQRIVGVYFDTNNLKVRFCWPKEKVVFSLLDLSEFFDEKELQDFCNGQLGFYPAVSIHSEDTMLELNSTACFKSIKKAEWIKNKLQSDY